MLDSIVPRLRPSHVLGVCLFLASGTLIGGCGGTEEGDFLPGELTAEELAVLTQDLDGSASWTTGRCFPAGKKRWTTQRAALRARPRASSKRRLSVPRGALVRLSDLDGDGQVCRKKVRKDQSHWFLRVRYAGQAGWISIDRLTPDAPRQNPVPGYRITTPFGKPGSWAAGYHTGDDYAAPTGATVVATRPGTVQAVSRSAYGSAYGLHVVVETREGDIQLLYAHLSAAKVRVGQEVQQGTPLGRVGNTGRSFGAHLHYEERVSPYGYSNHRKPRFNR